MRHAGVDTGLGLVHPLQHQVVDIIDIIDIIIDIIDIIDIITDIYLEHEAHVADDHPLAEVVVQRLLLTSGFV